MGKKLLALLLCAGLAVGTAFGATACGGNQSDGGNQNNSGNTTGDNQNNGNQSGGNQNGNNQQPTYTVAFNTDGGTSINSVSGVEGTAVNIAQPTKKDYIFDGWYSDADKTQTAQVPSTVPGHNVTLYAKWISAKDCYLAARKVITDASKFEYDYTLSVTTKLSALGAAVNGPTANIAGNLKYNSQSSVSYLKTEVNSGALLYDGTVYTYNDGDSLKVIKQNEKGKVYDYNESELESGFKYESSMYAKALFEFEDEDITAVTDSSTSGVYNISYTQSASGKIVSGAFKVLSSPTLKKFVDSMPDVANSFKCTVTFNGKSIAKYAYSFTASVAGQQATVSYELTMKSVGENVTIVSPNIAGLATNGEVYNTKLGEITSALTAYRAKTTSGYNYDVKTAVDYPGANAINSRSQGRTMRKLQGGEVYFWNRLELDSDYKNNDLYKSAGIVDYERYRARISNGDIYDREDGLLSNPTTKVECSEAQQQIDEFYFLPQTTFFAAENISLVQYAVNSKTGEKTYSLGLKTAAVEKFLKYINSCTRLDVNLTKNIDIYNITSGSLSVSGVQFEIVLGADGSLSSIEVVLKGSANGAYTGTQFSGDYNFKLNYSITVNDKGDNYAIPTAAKDITLPNS